MTGGSPSEQIVIKSFAKSGWRKSDDVKLAAFDPKAVAAWQGKTDDRILSPVPFVGMAQHQISGSDATSRRSGAPGLYASRISGPRGATKHVGGVWDPRRVRMPELHGRDCCAAYILE